MSVQSQRGVVLIVVLWLTALLTVLLAAFTLTVKTDRQTAAGVMLGVQTRTATDAVLNYLAALNAVSAPELEEMPGQRYELKLGDQEVSFRIVPESAFIPINQLSVQPLTALLSYMQVESADDKALHLIQLRSERLDEETGDVLKPMMLQSVDQAARLLDVDVELLRPFERWFSFVGQHGRAVPGYVPDKVLGVVEQFQEPQEQEDSLEIAWQPSASYRVQVEVSAPRRPRKMEAIASFAGSQYRLLLINEYNVDFSLNDLSE